MELDAIRTCCTARPFRPFTVHLSDGRSFPVAHPDFLIVAPNSTTVIVFHEAGGFDILDPAQITGIALPRPPSRPRSAARKTG